MSARLFLDTNVLVYAIESAGREPDKSSAALRLTRRDDVCLSTQVLGEFYRATTNPRREHPLTHEEAVAWVQLWKSHDVHPITVPHVDMALEMAGRYGIGYYDALIIAAAHFAECPVVCSEDLADGQEYAGVRVENPFARRASGGRG
jgi:predicted nucleic acid-binding protein